MRASKIDSKSYALKILEHKGVDAIGEVWIDSLDRNCIVGIDREKATILIALYDFDPDDYPSFIDEGAKREAIEEVMAKANFSFTEESAVYSMSIMQMAETLVNEEVMGVATCTTPFEAVATGKELKKTND